MKFLNKNLNFRTMKKINKTRLLPSHFVNRQRYLLADHQSTDVYLQLY